MYDDESPSLGVGFAIEAGSSFDTLLRVENAMAATESKLLPAAARIERGTANMVNLGGATAQIRAFGSSATRELQAVNREKALTTKSGEALVRQLEREAAAIGKTRDELRAAKVETLALAAAQQGNTDLSDRLFSAARQRDAAVQAAAEAEAQAATARTAAAARERAAAEAAVNAQLLERARLEAALGRTMGADRPRATDAGATFSALAARAAEDEARATDMAAVAARRAAEEHNRLAAAVRGSHAAQMADAEAAERLRMSTDPLYASTKRLNAEIAESERLYRAGATAPAEYARQQEVLTGRLNALGAANDNLAATGRRGAGSMTQLSFQINDVATMAAMGAKPTQIFVSQIGQIVQIAQTAEGGVKGFAKEVGGLALRFAPLLAATAVAGVALWRFKEQISADADLKKYADGLGLTHKEMKKLGDVSVTTGDMMSGLWTTIQDRMGTGFSGKKLIDYLFSPNDAKQVGTFVSQIHGVFVGGYKGVIEIWGLLPNAMREIFGRAVNGGAAAIEKLINLSVQGLNWLVSKSNSVLRTSFATIGTVSLGRVQENFGNAGARAGAALGKNVAAETKKAMGAMTGFVNDWAANTVRKSQDRLSKAADAIKADRTPKKDKPDRHAEQLAREAEAVEAQVRNLYALATAYRISGAEALIAEARVKAESEAIKKRGDIEEFVNRQVRLAVAQRVSDASKSTASMREQAGMQEEVNRAVGAGLVPAERAAELLRDRLALLPLVQAMGAAAARQDIIGASAALRALNEQRAARERLTAAERDAKFEATLAGGRDRLAELREELRYLGVADAFRDRALAKVRAEAEARKQNFTTDQAAAYVRQQIAIADETERLAAAQRDWNDQLSFTADRWDLIAQNVQDAARGMSEAFGSVGRAVGDMAAIYASYEADRARADDAHKTRLLAAGSEAARDREVAKYMIAISTRQVGLYGDMTAAAKGFFSEKSKGYQALATAEKVFRAVEFALSVRAMAQDAAETASKVAGSVFRTAKYAVEAVVKAISSLPFPANLAAGAATVGALAALGVSVAGGLGGGGAKPTRANEGTGTVLGDTAAKSESIKRAIDQLREVDTLMLSHSREMAASLRSIDRQIGGFAAQILKAGNINASAGVQTGFKTDTTGKVLSTLVDPTGLFSKIPVIGGVFGAVKSLIGSLFGSKTTITGTGLYGGAQSLGGILSSGFDASYYSDIKKEKKFFGIKTGTSYSTQFTGADPTLENQFTLILRSFNDAIGAAAGPLGESTAAIEQRLSGFIVNIGKIDLTGLTGEQITEKLTAVFGAAADQMAGAAFPGVAKWQKAGEGLFETAVRVASTVEAVTGALGSLGAVSQAMSIDAKLGLAAQFDSVGELTSAAEAYFERFYSKEERARARLAQFGDVFASLGLTLPSSLASYRQLIEAQNLTTEAGQETYATLLRMAPAFAELQEAMNGAKSAADVLAERQDLERKLLEVRGDTAALRALDLARLDESNRALQLQIYAIQDAQEAARAADQLRDAWTSVADGIMEEVRRIRGLSGAEAGGGFAAVQGRFNAATAAARGGDMEAAKTLTVLSQSLLNEAEKVATSRQELDRIRAQTAAALEGTYGAIKGLGGGSAGSSVATLLAAVSASQAASAPVAANDSAAQELRALREEVAAMRRDNNAGHAATAGNTGKLVRTLEDVTADGSGQAISVVAAAA
jgi:hypothetical protein